MRYVAYLGYTLLVAAAVFIVLAAWQSPKESAITAEEVMAEQAETYEELAKLLQTIKNKETIEKAWPELSRLHQRQEQLRQQAVKLPRPEADSEGKMAAYRARLQSALKRIRAEMQRIPHVPGGQDMVDKLEIIRFQINP